MRLFYFISLAIGCCAAAAHAQAPYQPGEFQNANPNYPKRNPFYFEGRIDWDLLKIDQPANAWEYMQRGIHEQDDLEDFASAITDYRQSVALNSLDGGSCQIVTAAPVGFGQNTDPPPCMFTVRLRLANLLKKDEPDTALKMLNEVLQIDPLRLGVNAVIAQTYTNIADAAPDEDGRSAALQHAVDAYQAELSLSPVTDLSRKLTGDEANNAHVHWELANLYGKLARPSDEIAELTLYLKATTWHSDTYPWRIQLAKTRLQNLTQ